MELRDKTFTERTVCEIGGLKVQVVQIQSARLENGSQFWLGGILNSVTRGNKTMALIISLRNIFNQITDPFAWHNSYPGLLVGTHQKRKNSYFKIQIA